MTTVQFVGMDTAGRPLGGWATLSRPGALFRCPLTAGRCSFNIPGGLYTLSYSPPREFPPFPRSVVVPPSGTLRLTVRSATSPAALLYRPVPLKLSVRPAFLQDASIGAEGRWMGLGLGIGAVLVATVL
jgi:hypothetical protein